MNVLQQLRAACAAPPVPVPAQQPAAPLSAPLPPCPFVFGPWLPRTDPQAHPEEAQRTVSHGATLIGWWRREWITPPPFDADPLDQLQPFMAHSLYTPDGRLVCASCHADGMLHAAAQHLQLVP